MPLRPGPLSAAALVLATLASGARPAAADSAERPPSTGFQMSIRTGARFPIGDATGTPGDQLSRRYAWQIPISVGIGGKITDAFYLGGYLGFGFGAEGSDFITESACDDKDDNLENDIACSVFSGEIGVEGHYSFNPGARWNPWIGYGIGYESSQETIEDRRKRYRETQFSSGYTLGKFSVGVDRRSSVGFGPFLEVAVGRFTNAHTDVNDNRVSSGAISSQAFHAWITLGLRFVVSP